MWPRGATGIYLVQCLPVAQAEDPVARGRQLGEHKEGGVHVPDQVGVGQQGRPVLQQEEPVHEPDLDNMELFSESLHYIKCVPDYYENYLEKTVRPPVVARVEVVVHAPHVEVDHVAKAVAAKHVGVEGRLEVELHVVLLDEGWPHRLEVGIGHVLDDLHRMGIEHGTWGHREQDTEHKIIGLGI